MSASAATRTFFEAAEVDIKRSKSGAEFFGFSRQDVQQELKAALDTVPQEPVETTLWKDDVACHTSLSGAGKRNDSIIWMGLISLGKAPNFNNETPECVVNLWQTNVNGEKRSWNPGFQSKRLLRNILSGQEYDVVCSVLESGEIEEGPLFRCTYQKGGTDDVNSVEGRDATVVINEVIRNLGMDGSALTKWRNYNGASFFGLGMKEMEHHTKSANAPPTACTSSVSGVWQEAHNVSRRNAGDLSALSGRFRRRRLRLAHRAVESLLGSEEISTFVTYLANQHPDVLYSGVSQSQSILNRLHTLISSKPIPVRVSCKDSAELILAGNLSQRSYKVLKNKLKNKNVLLARYDNVSIFLRELNVGPIEQPGHDHEGDSAGRSDCICALTNLEDTLQRMISTTALFEAMVFPSEADQAKLFKCLAEKDTELYGRHRSECKTLFLRQSGDNYRSFRLPTQQMSFALLNLQHLASSPYGQMINGIWRGPENRDLLATHCAALYKQLEILVRNGVDLLHDGQTVHFNVVVFYVADLAHLVYVLGRAGLAAKYGCWRCKKAQTKWADTAGGQVDILTVKEMVTFGAEAMETLGENPHDDNKQYTSFHHTHFGQVRPLLFSALIQETMPPCGLHLILAIHRMFWKVIHSIVKTRNQQGDVSSALHKIGCYYLAFQLESHYKSKGKHYDGNEQLRMTGNDCKRLEFGAREFISSFLHPNEAFTTNKSATKLNQVLTALEEFRDIAQDLRSTTTTEDRVASFQDRVDKFYMNIKKNVPSECTFKLYYMHVLRDHVAVLMRFWFDQMKWGYGMFSTSAVEHLNKRLKVYEADHYTQSALRFKEIIRRFRVNTFYFTNAILLESKSKVTCSACGASGHTKKNKLCPNHIDQY